MNINCLAHNSIEAFVWYPFLSYHLSTLEGRCFACSPTFSCTKFPRAKRIKTECFILGRQWFMLGKKWKFYDFPDSLERWQPYRRLYVDVVPEDNQDNQIELFCWEEFIEGGSSVSQYYGDLESYTKRDAPCIYLWKICTKVSLQPLYSLSKFILIQLLFIWPLNIKLNL